MQNHLEHVFATAMLPSVRDRHSLTKAEEASGPTAAEMAERVARVAFKTCDLDDDGRLSFEEFTAWLSRVGNTVAEHHSHGAGDDASTEAGSAGVLSDSSSSDEMETGMDQFTLQDLQKLTNLEVRLHGGA